MSYSTISNISTTWTPELEKLVATKVCDTRPKDVLALSRQLMGGEISQELHDGIVFRWKQIELAFLSPQEFEEAAMRQAEADRLRRATRCLDERCEICAAGAVTPSLKASAPSAQSICTSADRTETTLRAETVPAAGVQSEFYEEHA